MTTDAELDELAKTIQLDQEVLDDIEYQVETFRKYQTYLAKRRAALAHLALMPNRSLPTDQRSRQVKAALSAREAMSAIIGVAERVLAGQRISEINKEIGLSPKNEVLRQALDRLVLQSIETTQFDEVYGEHCRTRLVDRLAIAKAQGWGVASDA